MKNNRQNWFLSAEVPRLWPFLGLIALLSIEILWLTIRFDTQSLEKVHSGWGQLIGFTPQFLRLGITVLVVTLLFSGRRLWSEILKMSRGYERPQWQWSLATHFFALTLFASISATLMSGDFASLMHPGLWVVGWFLLGGTTFIMWALVLLPKDVWLTAARNNRKSFGWGIVLGTGAWATGFLSEKLWKPLAGVTFTLVRRILFAIYAETISDPGKLIVGTPKFRVQISPQCSGYEGVGLVLVFLGIYLWLFRKDLRFPRALLLLPIGAIAIWCVNLFRIVALVVIGTSGWPEVAKGGFHSQAGWLTFNAVSLGLVAITMRGRYFMKSVQRAPELDVPVDETTAYLAPFLMIVLAAMITGALSGSFDWLYPVRVLTVAGVLWAFRKSYNSLKGSLSWVSVLIGGITFVIWLALIPAGAGAKDGWPAALKSIPHGWAAAWLFFRVLGYVLIVPLAEELAFRGYLTRRLMQADFQRLPVGIFSWPSFLISSIVFGALHGKFWLGATIAGVLFAVAFYRKRNLGDAVLAHGIANGLIASYVFATGRWSVWS